MRFSRWIGSLAASAALAASSAAQTTWFVDASKPAGGNGVAWASAFDDLQSALDVFVSGDQIWVARGVYKPSREATPGNARTASFLMPNGGALIGGFAGTEASIAERAGSFAATVLDGDIGVIGNAADNCLHVVKMEGASIFTFASIDGFTIRNGNATTASSTDSHGGGILCSAAGATHGPSLFAYNCIVRDNVADVGGGIAAVNLAHINLANCVVRDNVGVLHGGGMLVQTSYSTSYNTLWLHNRASGDGGAVYSNSTSNEWVEHANDVFRDNLAGRGGAVGIAGSQFVRGSATLEGCTLAYNAAQIGGAIFAETTTAAKAQLRMVNSIVWANTAPSAPQIKGSGTTIKVSRSDVEGGFGGVGNLNVDPQFVDGARRDLHLRPGSPACDAGDSTLVPRDYFDFDHDGNLGERVPYDHERTRRFTDDPLAPDVGVAHVNGWTVDLGAFER